MTRSDCMSVLLGIIVRYILVAGRGRWDDPIGHAPSIACLPVERLGDRNAPTILLNPQVGRELTEPGHRIGQPFLVARGVDRRDATRPTTGQAHREAEAAQAGHERRKGIFVAVEKENSYA